MQSSPISVQNKLNATQRKAGVKMTSYVSCDEVKRCSKMKKKYVTKVRNTLLKEAKNCIRTAKRFRNKHHGCFIKISQGGYLNIV